MGVISSAVKHMVAAGMTPEAILAAVIDIESALNELHPAVKRLEELKAKDRTRKKASVEIPGSGVLLELDNKILSEGGVGETTPRKILEGTLDPERAAAVVEHRQRLRKSMTCRAAKLLAAEFAKAPDPNAAADLMMARGWTGFEVGWLKNGKDPPKDRILDFKPRGKVKTWAEIKAERDARG
jgi:hypothetical protein